MNVRKKKKPKSSSGEGHTPRSFSGLLRTLLDPAPGSEHGAGSPDFALTRRARVALWALATATLASLVPFLSKAFHMDDPLFLWIARHIQNAPLDPLRFDVIWYWTVEPMYVVTKNPPLAAYYLAVAAPLIGWSELSLHLAMLVPAVALITGTFLLARHFCARPALAALLTLFTPVVLVSGTTVMSDVMMMAFWVFALFFWVRGLESGSRVSLLASVLLVAASALTKYYGMTLIPLLLLYAVARDRRSVLSLLFLLIPVGILAVYQAVTGQLYGRGLLSDAASYATEFRPAEAGIHVKFLVALTFTGGCVLGVAFFSHLLWQRRTILAGFLLAVLIALVAASVTSSGGYPLPTEPSSYWLRAAQIGVFAVTGLGALSLALSEVYRKRDPETLVLAFWVIGTVLFAGFINWSTNARSILPLVPALGILVARRLDRREGKKGIVTARRLFAPLMGAALAALVVCWGDFRYANSARDGAEEVLRKTRNTTGTVWFQGHWGFQYYMEKGGAKPIDTRNASFNPGDVVIQPFNNTNLFPMEYDWAVWRESITVRYSPFLSTMGQGVSGFYADERGPLPFAFGLTPPEQYHIFDVK